MFSRAAAPMESAKTAAELDAIGKARQDIVLCHMACVLFALRRHNFGAPGRANLAE